MLIENAYPNKSASRLISFIYIAIMVIMVVALVLLQPAYSPFNSFMVCTFSGFAISAVSFVFLGMETMLNHALANKGFNISVIRVITLTFFGICVWVVPITTALYLSNKAGTSMVYSPIIFGGWLLIAGSVIALIPSYCWLMRKVYRRINR